MIAYRMKIKFWNTLVLCLFASSVMAQKAKLTKANKDYEALAYIDASEVYKEVAQSGFKSEELFKKLGNTSYFNANYEDAAKWYAELFTINPDPEAIYFLRYAQALKATGNTELAKTNYDHFASLEGITTEITNEKDFNEMIEENSGRYTITHSSVNSSGLDFGGTLLDNKLIFSSSRDTGVVARRISAWDKRPFLDLYEAERKEDGSFGRAKKIEKGVNSKWHESSAVFTKDGMTMYFTRSNITPKAKRGKKDIQQVKIYRAHLVDGKWTNIEDLSINRDNYSTAHPMLNDKEDKLYFVSNMPSSYGQTDIFEANIYQDGSLGEPINLGETINTKGRESFPFITEDNELYFSSDGHYGVGGYDVFYVKLKENGKIGKLFNVGKPINSAYDDFSFSIKEGKGFISSNRPGGEGYDDIYEFVEIEPIKETSKKTIEGLVTDNLNQPIEGVDIVILDTDQNEIARVKTGKDGKYKVEVENDKPYTVNAVIPGYEGDNKFTNKNDNSDINFELTPESKVVTEQDDIADILNIIIYFDYNKWDILPLSRVELEKIVVVMKNNPEIKIDIRSHTDSRGSKESNERLSEKRAEATVNYLLSRGISKDRLTGKGFGEYQISNRCKDNIDCSEVEHQKNRRSEFIVIKE